MPRVLTHIHHTITIYRQPDDQQRNHRSTCAEFKQLTQALSNYLMELPSPTPDLIICGDLILPHADWENGKCQPGATKDEQQMVQELHTLTTENFMVQYVDEPTHRDGNTLDLLFSNNSDLVHSFTSSHSLLSDHLMIEFKAVYKPNTSHQEEKEAKNENEAPKPSQPSFRNFNFFSDKINWESINHAFSNYNWWRDFKGCTPDAMMKKFCAICLATVPDYVPPRSKAQSSSNKIPRHRRILMMTRCRINIQLSKAPPEERRQALKKRLMEIEKKLQYSYHSQTAAREKKAVDSIQQNPKYFFSYAKSFSKIKIGIGPLIDAAKTLITNPKEMAEILAEQYSLVFSQPKYLDKDAEDLFPHSPSENSGLCDVLFSESDLIEAIEELKPNSAAGPDDFPAKLLIMCRHSLARPLYTIWRHSLNTGQVPDLCKFANIVPIHKGKSRAAAKNYRPVALTSLLIKIFEKVIRKHLVSFMEEHQMFNHSQHGFCSGRSCLSQLLAHFDHITHICWNRESLWISFISTSPKRSIK